MKSKAKQSGLRLRSSRRCGRFEAFRRADTKFIEDETNARIYYPQVQVGAIGVPSGNSFIASAVCPTGAAQAYAALLSGQYRHL